MIPLTPGLQGLFDLVNAPDKEVRRRCDDMVVTYSDVNGFIVLGWCGQLVPYECRTHAVDHKPDDFRFTPKDLALIAALRDGEVQAKDGKKFAGKLAAMFDKRTKLQACMLTAPDLPTWHLLYFTQRDQAEGGNHWVEGQHVHYRRGQRDGRLTADMVWDRVCAMPPNPPTGEHIRCVDPSEPAPC
ncbi:hypothetical protein [Variovorax saccharolyticus]|uniref:hypothetical protein n=1 Tax=Variovorax saccharolyticus TaxID=3053516 RepID=UPI002578D4A0|nr:hypothetical protein [Variovorax sp. J31P216]MDM0029858.1 hypothetical protein [Variovorax sp. J31P216]